MPHAIRIHRHGGPEVLQWEEVEVGAVFDISDDVPGCIVTGAAKIADAARVPLADVTSVHHGHCPEIEITSDSTATGIGSMDDCAEVARWLGLAGHGAAWVRALSRNLRMR